MTYLAYSKKDLISLLNNIKREIGLLKEESIIDIHLDKDNFIKLEVKNDHTIGTKPKRES